MSLAYYVTTNYLISDCARYKPLDQIYSDYITNTIHTVTKHKIIE